MGLTGFRSTVSLALLLVSTACVGSRALAATPPDDSSLPGSQFDLVEKTQIPGETLAPGHYSIRVLDHFSDRMILQVENDKGKARSTFLALPNTSVGAGRSGAIPYGDGKNAALRGFVFDNGTTAEFVYPKGQAVSIARQNSTKVPAIDPPSEGMAPEVNKMSQNDRAVVTLWLLSPTFVGSESKPSGVLAQRYAQQAPLAAPAPATQPVVAETRPVPSQPAVARTPAPEPQPVQMAQVTRKPVLAHLPHTAGSVPLLWLIGCLSLFGALGLRFRNGLVAGA